jgi:tRNA A-37 threonylcarbamoyl transferase component Bud32
MEPEAGQTVGSVVLRSKIADGGMASVWAAEHVTLDREVAVKFLQERYRADHLAVRRFALEARTIARVSSPHVPQVFDHGIASDGTPYIVMELVPGTDLKSWVAEWGCLDVAQAVRLVDHMSLALGAAHELGIVHRDVKPENMILSNESADFCAKLVDFGIAKSTALSLSAPSLTLPGIRIGTPCYMSPEQLTNPSEVDERSDVWSLGVVTYWALTGKLPFVADTFAETCDALTHARFTPPSELRPDLPIELDVWFSKVLCVDVRARVQSVDLMNRMLKVAVATPAEWTHRMPAVAPPPRVEADLDVARANGEVPRAVPQSGPVRVRRRRANVLYAMGAVVGGAILVARLGLVSPTAAWSSDARGSTAPAGFVGSALAAPSSSAPAAPQAPPPPVVSQLTPSPSASSGEVTVPSAATPALRSRGEAHAELGGAPRALLSPGVGARAGGRARAALPSSTVHAQGTTLPPRAPSAAPSGQIADVAPPPQDHPSDWHPRDDLGEP